ncbi:hypothetical protein Patl1_09736 [Pistacia atlantica]|uniref:Uncharacterized protein n=1 Tax=Pistacia atlantica TaxID=434234 RepID=A0ACC1A516_9ROSI|nr:hypothetical protein Patl1_09736 [Pistacia atlantica]
MQKNWLDSSKSWFPFWAKPGQQCGVHANCGPFGRCSAQTLKSCECLQGFQPKSKHDWNFGDYSGGCERKTQLQCQNNSVANGKRDKFLTNSNMALPENPQPVAARSVDDCETTCLNNCSCTAYAYEDNQCLIWFGNLLGVQESISDGVTLYIKLAASEFSSPKRGRVIGGVVGSVALVVVLGLVVFLYLRRRKKTIKTTNAVEGGEVLSLLDPRLEENADVEELSRICKVAVWCIQDDETHRPTMGQVVQTLEGVLNVSRYPIPRTLQVFVDNPEQIFFFTESSSSQSSQ